MKYIISIITLVILTVINSNAQTNNTSTVQTNSMPRLIIPALNPTNDLAMNKTGYEFTLGGSGFTSPKTGGSQFGIDASIEFDPITNLRSLWFCYEQALSWTPSFAGYSDVFSEWSVSVFPSVLKDKLYENTGWDAGVTYAAGSQEIWNTGPHTSLQYFTSDNAFIFGQVNYNLYSRGNPDITYTVGIGIAF